MFDINQTRIGVIGLGYVGLPLAVEFGKQLPVVGFDINKARIAELKAGKDSSLEVEAHELKEATELTITADLGAQETCNFYIVMVYESTVYPGCTEEDCVPIIERESGLKFNTDFFVGYSPERINPGDKEHRVTNIVKVTSGSTPEVADYVDTVYRRVIKVGTHKASSIRVAEAAKNKENTQRDVNIALINELALRGHRMGINSLEVLEAAGSK